MDEYYKWKKSEAWRDYYGNSHVKTWVLQTKFYSFEIFQRKSHEYLLRVSDCSTSFHNSLKNAKEKAISYLREEIEEELFYLKKNNLN